MGPHPGRKKLVVRTFEQKPGRYAERALAKAEAPVELKQHQPAVIARKAKPKIRPPGPGAGPQARPLGGRATPAQARPPRRPGVAEGRLPVLFGYPPRPLAVGIGKLIAPAARAAGIKREDIGAALHYFTRAPKLFQALAADGAMRLGLDGEPVGPVESEHRTEALKLLAVIVRDQSEAFGSGRSGRPTNRLAIALGSKPN